MVTRATRRRLVHEGWPFLAGFAGALVITLLLAAGIASGGETGEVRPQFEGYLMIPIDLPAIWLGIHALFRQAARRNRHNDDAIDSFPSWETGPAIAGGPPRPGARAPSVLSDPPLTSRLPLSRAFRRPPPKPVRRA